MKHLIEPLARVPGVRCALLATPDGVPISIHVDRTVRRDEPGAPRASGADEMSALAALATSWTNEVQRATAPLSWGAPERLVLRAARGTLCIVEAPGALLVVILDSGLSAEELRVPMDATVARIQRHLRALEAERESESTNTESPPGLFPARPSPRECGVDVLNARSSGDPVPDSSGE